MPTYSPHITLAYLASMGPPSGDGGYVCPICTTDYNSVLQWVHRPVTVVMNPVGKVCPEDVCASMGPPSGDGGYVRYGSVVRLSMAQLQWVHRPVTVVMACSRPRNASYPSCFNGS